jgi:hypothetical protein
MPIIYRLQKGSPLTLEEVDGNFKELHQRLEALEQNQVEKVQWGGRFELCDSDLLFLNPENEVLSRVHLPLPHFYPKGRWQPHQLYAGYDIVTTGKQAYCCIKSHQSSDLFTADQESWQLLLDSNFITD